MTVLQVWLGVIAWSVVCWAVVVVVGAIVWAVAL